MNLHKPAVALLVFNIAFAVFSGIRLAESANRATFITKARVSDGSLLVEPILTPTFRLTPLNAVASGTALHEALTCKMEVLFPDTPDVMVVLRCGDAEFELRGVIFQE